MDRFYIKSSDTSPAIEVRLSIYSLSSNVLNGASARFHMRNDAGIVVDEAATISDVDGDVLYEWQTGDTDIAGDYNAEFEITYADSTIETFPNSKNIKVIITSDIA